MEQAEHEKRVAAVTLKEAWPLGEIRLTGRDESSRHKQQHRQAQQKGEIDGCPLGAMQEIGKRPPELHDLEKDHACHQQREPVELDAPAHFES
ncbi:MAG: hypothetical protein INR68_05300 [Methylobacterium mesophilicum]|nr:hypothetical protein [Methylobacterium mesophilicum]